MSLMLQSLVQWSLSDLGATMPVEMLASFTLYDRNVFQNVHLLICNEKYYCRKDESNVNGGILALGFCVAHLPSRVGKQIKIISKQLTKGKC